MIKNFVIFIFLIILTTNLYSQNNRNQIGLMMGGKFIKKTDSFAPSFGLNYEYKFLSSEPLMGIGVISDVTLNNNLELNGGLALYIHPTKKMRLFVAPGVYYVNYGMADDGVTKLQLDTEYGTQLRFVMQAGGEYYFKINSFDISPFLKIELLENNYRVFLGVGVTYNL